MPIKSVIAALVLASSFAPIVHAQVAVDEQALRNQIEAMRSVMATERKILIIKEMNMTTGEAEQFWPLYEEYHKEMQAIGNLRAKIITDYAANYAKMTDEMSKELLDDSMDYTEQKYKLKKKYIKKFREILPSMKVTRYFQLENKLDAIVDYQLAAEIPLMK
jgi:hypothetical protein